MAPSLPSNTFRASATATARCGIISGGNLGRMCRCPACRARKSSSMLMPPRLVASPCRGLARQDVKSYTSSSPVAARGSRSGYQQTQNPVCKECKPARLSRWNWFPSCRSSWPNLNARLTASLPRGGVREWFDLGELAPIFRKSARRASTAEALFAVLREFGARLPPSMPRPKFPRQDRRLKSWDDWTPKASVDCQIAREGPPPGQEGGPLELSSSAADFQPNSPSQGQRQAKSRARLRLVAPPPPPRPRRLDVRLTVSDDRTPHCRSRPFRLTQDDLDELFEIVARMERRRA
jgi:hypothetical protein